MTTWTREAIEALGPTTTVPVLAEVFEVHTDTIYEQIRRGEWNATRVLRLGRKIRIPTLDLLTLLYGATPAAPSPCQHGPLTQVTDQQSQSQCGCTPPVPGVVHQLRGA